jgi:hypothetical protein
MISNTNDQNKFPIQWSKKDGATHWWQMNNTRTHMLQVGQNEHPLKSDTENKWNWKALITAQAMPTSFTEMY